MKLLASIQGVVWLLQLITCGMSFQFLFNTVARILFVGKLVGMRVKLKVIAILEITGIVLLVLIPLVFGWQIHWWKLLLAVLFSLISLAIAWYDDYEYVYIEEDVVHEA